MISWFKNVLLELRRIAEALGGLVDAVHALNIRPSEDAKLAARVADLELSVDRREAEAEALLLKAKGKFDAARAAEERTRRLAEGNARSDEELEESVLEAYAEAGIPLSDAPNGEEEGVPPVSTRLGRRHESKQNALSKKWGLT